MTNYVPLYIHSEYSLIDSTLRIKQLVAYAQENHLQAMAITERNNLYSAMKVYKALRAVGIKPVLGCDMSVRDSEGNISQMLLYAQHAEGFKRLCELLSFAYVEDQVNGVVAVDIKHFNRKQCEGILALSGGIDGAMGKAILNGKPALAEEIARFWQGIFPDRFYLQVSRVGKEGEEALIGAAAEIGQKLNLPTVATNFAVFLNKEDFGVHEARFCIANSYVMDDTSRPHDYTREMYMKSVAEMEALWADAPQLLENTLQLAKRCNVTLDIGHHYLPDFPLPEGSKEIKQYLVDEAHKGLEARMKHLYPDEKQRAEVMPTYLKRLDWELGIVNQMNFPGYFLIVAEFIQWAKDHGVPVGPGRGSGASSLVAYAIRITDLDPLRFDLLFERFLNPERVSMPDFDVDFCMDKRELVIRHVADTYGHEKVSQITTFGTMAAKGVVRDVGRVMGIAYPVVDRITKLVPNALGVTLSDALGRTEKSKEKPEYFSAELLEQYENNAETQDLINLALKLEGLARNVGKHAGGVVIAPTKLTDFSALYSEYAQGPLVTQFDKDDIEQAGLVKFDFLGLKTLTVIDWAVQNINLHLKREGKPQDFDISDVPLDDKKTFSLLKACKTTAIFQLESSGMKNLIKKLQPDTFEDIVALVALFRPGPLQSGMVDDFINRKHGVAKVEYPDPRLEPILNNTYGVIVYQEQVMQVAQVLANYSLGEADLLRRAMGKKKAYVMDEHRGIFVKRAVAGGMDQQVATDIFNLMAKFAEYGFNKSHSVAYALLSYQTAWMKTHYPAEFMAAILTSDMDTTEKVVAHIDECQDMGLTVLPPSINHSFYDFTVDEQGCVVFGLGAVKGVGQGVIELITNEREKNGKFKSVLDLCERIDVKALKRKTLETLIYAGAFDEFNKNRGGLMAVLPTIIQLAQQHHENEKNKQSDMFGLLGGSGGAARKDIVVPDSAAWAPRQQLEYEKETLGLFLSDHPVNAVRKPLLAICGRSLAELNDEVAEWAVPKRRGEFREVKMGGLIVAIRKIITKKGQPMAFVTLDDRSARKEVTIFGELLEAQKELIKIDSVVVVSVKAEYAFYQQDWRLTATDVQSFEDARFNLARAVRIEAPLEKLTPPILENIKALKIEQQEAQAAGVGMNFALLSEAHNTAGKVRLPGRYAFGEEQLQYFAHQFGEEHLTLIY